MRSLSARRAWIEITHGTRTASRYTVALRKESVDRNRDVCQSSKLMYQGSLSARRAWIEMVEACNYNPVPWRRSPQGERG